MPPYWHSSCKIVEDNAFGGHGERNLAIPRALYSNPYFQKAVGDLNMAIRICISHFPCYCHYIPHKKQLKKGKVEFGSQSVCSST